MAATVLLIESDERAGARYEAAFRDVGADVQWCKSGEAGLDALTDGTPSLIVLAVELPGVSGYSVCKQIKLDERWDIPVFLVSATATQEIFDAHKRFRYKADDYFIKPPPERADKQEQMVVDLVARAAPYLQSAGGDALEAELDQLFADDDIGLGTGARAEVDTRDVDAVSRPGAQSLAAARQELSAPPIPAVEEEATDLYGEADLEDVPDDGAYEAAATEIRDLASIPIGQSGNHAAVASESAAESHDEPAPEPPTPGEPRVESGDAPTLMDGGPGAEVIALKARLATLENELADARSMAEAAGASSEGAEQELAEAANALEEVLGELEAARGRIAELEAAQASAGESEAQAAATEAALASERERAEAALSERDAEIERLRAELSQAARSAATVGERELLTLREHLSAKEREVLDLKDEIHRRDRAVLEERDRADGEARRALASAEELAEVREQLMTAQSALSAAEAAAASHETTANEAQQALDAARSSLEANETTITALESDLAAAQSDLESAAARSEALSSELKSARDAHIEATQAATAREQEAEAARAALEAELEQARTETRLAVQRAEGAESELETERTALRNVSDELAEANERAASLQEQLTAATERADVAAMDRDAARDKIVELEATAATRDERVAALESELASTNEALNELAAESDARSAREAEEHAERLASAAARHESEVAAALASQRSEYESTLETVRASAQTALEAAMAQRDAAASALTAAREDAATLADRRNADVALTEAAWREHVGRLETQVEAYREDVTALRAALDAARSTAGLRAEMIGTVHNALATAVQALESMPSEVSATPVELLSEELGEDAGTNPEALAPLEAPAYEAMSFAEIAMPALPEVTSAAEAVEPEADSDAVDADQADADAADADAADADQADVDAADEDAEADAVDPDAFDGAEMTDMHAESSPGEGGESDMIDVAESYVVQAPEDLADIDDALVDIDEEQIDEDDFI